MRGAGGSHAGIAPLQGILNFLRLAQGLGKALRRHAHAAREAGANGAFFPAVNHFVGTFLHVVTHHFGVSLEILGQFDARLVLRHRRGIGRR